MKRLIILLVLMGGFVWLVRARLLPNPIPIPQQSDARPVPLFLGSPAVANPVSAPAVPDSPIMSPGSWSNAHDDMYMSDTYPVYGPLGHSPTVLSSFLGTLTMSALPVVIIFDQAGRLVAGAIRVDPAAGTAQVRLVLIDPDTLATLAIYDLPQQSGLGGKHFRPAGAYFYNDNLDRTVIATAERTILVISHTATAFSLVRTYDLTATIPADDSFQSLQPDFSGRLWFSTKGGLVGTLNTATGGVLGTVHLNGERIDNSSAADETGGVFIASNQAMYRFDARSDTGAPQITWRAPYDAGTHTKAGQVDNGTGTTPTLMGTDYVTITDNAEPQMHVLVYRRGRNVTGSRLVCAEPVFKPGNSSTENSLIATDRSIVVENNFGYKSIESTMHGSTTKPGIARIDLDENGCHTVWSNDEVSIPTVISKMSLSNGLIYTYAKPKGPANTDAWYFTAIDSATGHVVFQQLAGTSLLYNNHYAGVYLGPNGTLYVGVLGGVVAMHDVRVGR